MTADDICAVTDVIASYSYSVDSGDLDRFLDLWTEDASLESANGRGTGHDGLTAWFRDRQRRVAEAGEQALHFPGIPQIHGDGQTASADTYTVIFRFREERGIRVHMVGRYEDSFVKSEDGKWRFKRRIIHAELE